MGTHAKLSPSSSGRWLACPGSVKACEGLPNVSGAFALEGTAAHELGEILLRTGADAESYIGTELPASRWRVTVEMVEFVQEYVDYVRAIGGKMEVEVRLDLGHIIPDGFGSSDVIVYQEAFKRLYVVDLKYGKGVKVYAEDNTQAMLYALGALHDYEMIYDIEEIVCVIHQPRLYHVDEWVISVEDLVKRGEEMRLGALRCFDENAPRIAGEKQCTFCLAKSNCPELLRYTSAAILCQFDAFEPLEATKPIENLTEEQMSNALSSRKLILSWFDAIEHIATERLSKGEPFHGYKLVSGRSSRSWSDKDAAISALEPIIGSALMTKPEIVSVAQAEKLLGKKQKNILEDLVVKSNGKPTLAPESDPRPPLESCSVESFESFSLDSEQEA